MEITYKLINMEINKEFDNNMNKDFFKHIFKKRKIEKTNELNAYLNERIVSEKTDILT
jgi:hypothetical protein